MADVAEGFIDPALVAEPSVTASQSAVRAPRAFRRGVVPQRRAASAGARSAICLALSLAMVGLAIAVPEMAHAPTLYRSFSVAALAAAAILGLAGWWLTLVALARLALSQRTVAGARGWLLHVAAVLGAVVLFGLNAFMAIVGALMALWATSGFARGRQLRRRGRLLLPRLHPGESSWTSDVGGTVDVDASLRASVAAQWRENAKTEHASVAAFARLTLDLMALGAPAHLLAAAQRDALDEVRHTQMCLSLASAVDGAPHEPAPFPEVHLSGRPFPSRTLALASLAAHSLVDGALHEGLSARVVSRLARLAHAKPVRDVLARIAADEGRHSAHGWQVVEWCVTVGGAPVLCAVQGAASALPHQVRASMPAAAEDGSWQRWGIHGRALEHDAYSATRAYVVRRVADLASRFAAQIQAA
ncbi:MAG TPA: hypothetical protein VEK07_14195 [Polyangiaceae bacterium]|nr:hypothetical protein [Polyangiaceae bacterium]